MFWWLDEPMNPSAIATTISNAYWAITIYVLVLIIVLVIVPPDPVDISDIQSIGDGIDELPAFDLTNRIRPLATASFMVACVLLFGRHVRLLSAVLAVAFAASTVALAVAATAKFVGFLPHPL